MKVKYIAYLVITLATSFESFSQETSYIDSLKFQLQESQDVSDSIRILCRLTWTIPEEYNEDVLQYGNLVLEKAKASTDSSLIADAYDAAAHAYLINEQKQEAKKLYKIALNIALRNNNSDRIAWSSYNLAKILKGEGNFAEMGIHAKRSYKHFKRLNNQRMAFDSYWLLTKLDENKYGDTLSQLIIEYLPNIPNEKDKIFYYIELSNLFNLSGKQNKAMYYVQLAMELAEKDENKKGIIKAYFAIADHFSNIQQNYAMAIKYLEKANEIVIKNNIKFKGDLYNRTGEIHRLMKNDSLANFYFNMALKEGEKNNHQHTKASAFMNLGDISYYKQKYNDALFYYLKCYETNCNVCPEITFHDVLLNIGNVYLFSNDLLNAQKYYQKSLILADSAKNERATCHSFQAFAKLYEKNGAFNKAIVFNLKAFSIAKKANFLEGQLACAESLSDLYSTIKNYKKAFDYSEKSKFLSDSLRERNEVDNLAKLETYFDFKNIQVQRELEKAKSNEEISKQKLYRNFFVIGFILIGIIGLAIFIGYRRKKRDNQLLYEQKLAIENMSKKVHDADQAKLQFFTNVSHEFKTPLTLIIGMTEKLRNSVNSNKQIEVIRKSSLKLLQLINNLLDLRKIDTSNMKLKVARGNIDEYLHGIIGSFENIAKQKKIILKYESKDKAVEGFFDSNKLEKIFSNLLSNALKYTNRNGHISISADKTDNGYLEITVADDGIGIQENEIKNIFNRFYRVSDSNNQGSGIGLALVKELIELHRGDIKVKSHDKGVSFIATIPISKKYYADNEIATKENEPNLWSFVDALDHEDNAVNEGESMSVSRGRAKKSILIVEDNYDLRRFIADIFVDNYVINEAKNGEEGYKMAQKQVPDLIISDIMMPIMSGIQLVDELKKNVATSHIPIILLTAKNDLATHLSSLEKGADDFISKPFDSIILKSRVENLFRLRKQMVERFSKQFQLQPREITIENADKKFLENTIEIIEANISNPNLNVELLAMELGVSRTQLYRKLNALTDYPPKHFIRIIRLKRAAQILEQGQNNMAEVMDATGFSNYSYFNNCFKDFFGKYPKEFVMVSVNGNLN